MTQLSQALAIKQKQLADVATAVAAHKERLKATVAKVRGAEAKALERAEVLLAVCVCA